MLYYSRKNNVLATFICKICLCLKIMLFLYIKGHTIGGHTHKHDALDSLETSEIKSDVV